MELRTVKGFLIAPLVPSLLAATIAAIGNRDIYIFPIAFLVYSVFAYLITLLFGVPVFLLMSRLGFLSLPQLTWAGALFGLVSGILLPMFLSFNIAIVIQSFNFQNLILLLGFCFFGAIAAWVFWQIAIRPQYEK